MGTNDITAMRRVSAYRTTDGRVHEERNDAVRWQAQLDLRTIVDEAFIGTGIADDQLVPDIVTRLIDMSSDVTRLLRLSQKGL